MVGVKQLKRKHINLYERNDQEAKEVAIKALNCWQVKSYGSKTENVSALRKVKISRSMITFSSLSKGKVCPVERKREAQ